MALGVAGAGLLLAPATRIALGVGPGAASDTEQETRRPAR
jgi:hypothetical protein